MADEYGQDFEKLSNDDGEYHEREAQDDYNDAPGDSHKMRLSVDIHSIKDTTFKGLVYAKYGAIQSLGIKPFSTIPAIQITKANVEEKFKNSFCSYEFVSNQQKLYNNLKEASLEIEVWHQDRFKKDMLIGIANVEIPRVLNSPERQAPQSFVRTYDAFIPLDEVDENRNPVKRVALLRVIIYLEDMGPLDYLRQHEREVKSKYMEELDEIATVPAGINLNHLTGNNVNDAEKVNFMNELSNIEYKIIWELENWKKAEEAKFRYQLKSKEVDFLKKLSEEWKKKENEREKTFKKSEASIQQIEQKLKQKTVELQKREQKLVLLEEELKQKINDTSRQLMTKDEEINAVKKKQKDDKAQFEKEKAILTSKKEDFESRFQKLQEEFMAFRREQETSPVNLIKNELSAKDLEINRLKGEIEKANQSKREYETYYQNLRGEILRLKKEKETLADTYARQSNAEIEQLKLRLSHMALLDNKENFQSLRNEFQDLRHQYQEDNLQQSGKNPFKGNYLEASAKSSLKAARTKSAQGKMDRTQGQGARTVNGEPTNEYERLVNERDNLLALGVYGEKDQVIVELNEQIRKLERHH